MAINKEEGLKLIEFGQRLYHEGVSLDPSILKGIDLENEYLEQTHLLFEWNHEMNLSSKIPAGFRIEDGMYNQLILDSKSSYKIIREGNEFFIGQNNEKLHRITFEKRPAFYNKLTSDGTKMSTIGQHYGDGQLFIVYSNECALKDQGSSCLFCNINQTKDTYAKHENIQFKNAKQIAETVKAAYDEGFKHVTISGGFIPERREVDYYIDIAEQIQEKTGLIDFNGSACVGAPEDLSVIEKYKEAGYKTIATNIEIWDENMFKVICPGKDKLCGGHKHWVDTLKEEVNVFGKGNVRSTLVAGIEPKESLLEGVEYLASIGVIAFISPWDPNPGSALELHRPPKLEWFLDVNQKAYKIYKKYFTHEQFFYGNAMSSNVFNSYYELDGDHLPWIKSNFN